MPEERQFPQESRVDDLDLSGVHLHGTNLQGARLTETYLMDADISGDIEGLRLNGVEIEPLVRAELDRLYPDRVRRHHQQAVRETLENLTDAGLAEVRAAPDSPGHPTGEHSVLQCLHVLLNEEWEHHRYTVRDLDVLDPAEASGS